MSLIDVARSVFGSRFAPIPPLSSHGAISDVSRAGVRTVTFEEYAIELDLGRQALALAAPDEWHELEVSEKARVSTRDLRPLLGLPCEARAGLRDEIRFLPPSGSHETTLLDRLYGDRPVPDGFVLADELLRRIRARDLDLTPTQDSGWYDWQTWALEGLAAIDQMPEGSRLAVGVTYRRTLDDLFKGLLTLSRETHVKQLEAVLVGAASMHCRCVAGSGSRPT